MVAGKGGETGKSSVWVKDVEGAVHSICSRLINGSDLPPVSDYSCLIFTPTDLRIFFLLTLKNL